MRMRKAASAESRLREPTEHAVRQKQLDDMRRPDQPRSNLFSNPSADASTTEPA